MKKLILGLSCLVLATSAFSAQQWYSSSWGDRTINVTFEQPVQAVSVYLAGTRNGRCIPANSQVYSMNFVSNSTVQRNDKLSGELDARGIKASASSQWSATRQNPAVFTKTYSDWGVRNLHYNIVYTRNGKRYQLGWQPDNGGGCTYRPPSLAN